MKFEEEIKNRPKRTWFQSEKEKKHIKEKEKEVLGLAEKKLEKDKLRKKREKEQREKDKHMQKVVGRAIKRKTYQDKNKFNKTIISEPKKKRR